MKIAILFASRETASYRMLAIPAVVRSLREVALAGAEECIVCVPGGWLPSAAEQAEIDRLAPTLRVISAEAAPEDCRLWLQGEEVVTAASIASALTDKPVAHRGIIRLSPAKGASSPSLTVPQAFAVLCERSRAILASTSKPTDGIVSRKLNRPISQAITRFLLTVFGSVPPHRATYGTALITVAMAACLVLVPGQAGLLWGAFLFHAASVFDGVDGEIARATFRSTPSGATFDSLVDAATNLSFFGGMMINLYLQGEVVVALIGVAALAGLAFGTAILGMDAVAKRGEVNFNSVKERLGKGRSPVMRWLTWMTMRDFYALEAFVLIALGLAVPGVIFFSAIVTGWLLVVLATLLRSGRKNEVR